MAFVAQDVPDREVGFSYFVERLVVGYRIDEPVSNAGKCRTRRRAKTEYSFPDPYEIGDFVRAFYR